MVIRYTTWGPIRGSCGHMHGTPTAAEECISRDRGHCRRAGGSTDREVRRLTGASLEEIRTQMTSYDVRLGPGESIGSQQDSM